MRASIPDLLGGQFAVAVRLPADSDKDNAARVRALLYTFIRAIALGFFDASVEQPAAVIPGSSAWTEEVDSIRLQFVAQNLPRGCFSVLEGMFVGHAMHLGTLVASATARREGDSRELLAHLPASLGALPELPFSAETPEVGPEHKSLRIWVDFREGVPEENRDRPHVLFETWDALAMGPFPAASRAVGDSWAGPSTTSFLLPSRIEHFVEDFEGGIEGINVLLRGLIRLHARLAIEHVGIE